ncbi:MAG TPA: hypothetical protein DCM14_08080 [Clostridiales bacterium UBA8153]|nr:hypothetical protein [Clostridiales bacterium UBA8153]
MTEHLLARTMERARVSRQRRLPLPGEVLVDAGAVVQPDTIVARTTLLPGSPYFVDVLHGLRISKETAPPDVMDRVMVVQVGDQVTSGDVIARYTKGFLGEVVVVKSPVTGVVEFISRVQGRVLLREDGRSARPLVVVSAAKDLDIWPRLLRMYVHCWEGDEIKQGQILAASPAAMGWDCCYAPVGGTVEKICTRTGTISIVRPVRCSEVDAYITGEVTAVIPGEGVEVSGAVAYVEGVFGLGGESHGPLVRCAGPGRILEADDILPSHEGCVLFGGGLVSLEAMKKAQELKVSGLISGGINQRDVVRFLGKEVAVGLIVDEGLDLTVVVTGGFGPMPMSPRAYQLLCDFEGAAVSVSGRTQVRAGTVRPEVLLPLGERVSPELPDADLQVAPVRGMLAPGTTVRVIRRSHFGQYGQVVAVSSRPQVLATEVSLYTVDVELANGTVITVAESNLETVL